MIATFMASCRRERPWWRGLRRPAAVRPGKCDLPDEIRPVRGVEADPCQGLVHGDHRVPVTGDAGPIAKCPGDGFADDVARVFGGVVEVDVQVAYRVQRDVDQA